MSKNLLRRTETGERMYQALKRAEDAAESVRIDWGETMSHTAVGDRTELTCGCGEYSISVSDAGSIYEFGAVCPECENHFGWSAEPDDVRGDGDE